MTTTLRLAGALIDAAALFAGATAPGLAQSGEVNIYSYREPGLIQPLLDNFTAETGIKANVLFAGDGLLERVAAEGELSPVDVVLTVDIGNLVGAKEQGLTQPITTPALAERLAPEFRDPEGHWAALSLRARVFYVSKDRVDATALTYEDIAKPEWKGRLCTRAGRPRLQYRAHRAAASRSGARQDPRVADRGARQPRLSADRRRPRGRQEHPRRHLRSLDHQHLLHGRDAQQRGRARAEGMGQLGAHRLPDDCRRRRHAGQRRGRLHRQVRAQRRRTPTR